MNVRQLFDLTDRVAIVTGGARGLGRAMALGLCEAGAHVVVCDIREDQCGDTARELQALGRKALAIKCDVTNPDDVSQMVQKTADDLGRIDILINNAGIAWVAAPEDIPLDKWNRVMNVNVTGTFLCSQAVGKVMIKQNKGKIINIASICGVVGLDTEVLNAIAYHASKGAVITFTKDLAAKWAKHNINVNAIAPSFFKTELTKHVISSAQEGIMKKTMLKRLGEEDDIKAAVVFLASDASNFITGHVLALDGGWLAW